MFKFTQQNCRKMFEFIKSLLWIDRMRNIDNLWQNCTVSGTSEKMLKFMTPNCTVQEREKSKFRGKTVLWVGKTEESLEFPQQNCTVSEASWETPRFCRKTVLSEVNWKLQILQTKAGIAQIFLQHKCRVSEEKHCFYDARTLQHTCTVSEEEKNI
jgi:hypothetical protein